VARIKANLRKTATDLRDVIYKDIHIDLQKHQVNVKGSPVQTTLKEYSLLKLLCEQAEKVQEREYIFNKVWGESFIGETRTLDIHIKELRKKLVDSATEIKTIRGVGYMLI